MTENPFRTPKRRAEARFVVTIHGLDETNRATRQDVAQVASLKAALGRMIGILRQWEASHGAIRPGTSVAIYDRHDGGKVIHLEYLGFEETLI